MNASPYTQYQQASVQTASPERLLIMLFEGAIKFLNMAKTGIQSRDVVLVNQNLIKTQNIINELMVTLNMDYPVSKNLCQLYDYMNYRLIQANIKKDVAMVDEVLEHMVELKDTFSQAAIKAKGEQAKVAGGVNCQG